MEISSIGDFDNLLLSPAARSSDVAEDVADLQQLLGNCSQGNLTPCEHWMELEQRPFVPSPQVQLLWTTLFSAMVSLAVLGNLAVISVVCRRRQLRTKVNLLLLNLSIADLLIATLNAMFNFVYMLKSQWPFGHFYCKVNNFVANLAVAAAVFTITATTFDRYYAVSFPLRPRPRNHSCIVALIWIASAVIASPQFYFSTTYTYLFLDGETRTLCFVHWPDGYSFMSTYDCVYNIIFFLVTYAIPLVAMFFTYTRMLPVLRSKAIGEVCSISQREALRAKQKAIPLLLMLALVFALCWLPYHLYFFFVSLRPMETRRTYMQHVYLAFYLLAMSNSTLNPLIYCLMNKRFRANFTGFLCCLKNEPLRRITSRTERSNYVPSDVNI